MISVQEYHNRTKHRFEAYAKGPESLDWDDQPDPFRRFEDCPIIKLPQPGAELPITWAELMSPTIQTPVAEMNLQNLGLLIELSFGLAAWKNYGPDLWSVRCNPSSGNLHPSEAYIISGIADLLPKGVYHYVSYDHHLEQRSDFDNETLSDGLYLGLSSVHWREAWKYGERAFRYCQLDAGHAFATLSYAASLLGWEVEWCHDITDHQLAHLLGLDRRADFVKREEEMPDWLCRIHFKTNDKMILTEQLLKAADQASWFGKAKSLKAYHMYHWKVIDETSQRALRADAGILAPFEINQNRFPSESQLQASKLIRERRSAQHYYKDAPMMSLKTFARLMSSVQAGEQPPFSGWDMGSAVHLCLFVHKVEGLDSGLYALPRSQSGLELLKNEMSADFVWEQQQDIPGLYLLHKGDVRKIAKSLSCHQAIASDSAFSLGMLAEFKQPVEQADWLYRRLFWECGVVGQALYMEAEAEQVRGTGIGCFFDDEVHSILGLKSDALQSLYHFTVGSPIVDERIQTLPPYYHLNLKD